MVKAQDLGGRLRLLAPAELTPAARSLYDRLVGGPIGAPDAAFKALTGARELIGPYNACLRQPEMGAAFMDLHVAERAASPLSARVREVVILSVGSVWQAPYELYAHLALAERAGFSGEAATSLAAGMACPELAREELVAQTFALQIAGGRRVSDRAYADAIELFGEERVVAIALLAGMYGLTCTILSAFAVPAPEEFRELRGQSPLDL